MRKANARERLLETAGKLFHERGYSEVGINEIIEKAETAKASFYQHFSSKQALCEAWLDTMHERSEQNRANILESDDKPVQKIVSYFDNLKNYMEASSFRGCPFSNTATVADEECCGIRSCIEEHKVSIRDFFHKLSAQFITQSDRAETVGDRLFLLYSGASVEAQTLRAIWPVDVAREAAVEICECEGSR